MVSMTGAQLVDACPVLISGYCLGRKASNVYANGWGRSGSRRRWDWRAPS